MWRCLDRVARLRRMTLRAVLFAVTRRARADVASRVLRVTVEREIGHRRGPVRRMELRRRQARVELRIPSRAEAGALVAANAERLEAVTRAAVGPAAPCVLRVGEQVIAGMKIHRLHHALMAIEALALR